MALRNTAAFARNIGRQYFRAFSTYGPLTDRDPVFIDGCRIPFAVAGTDLKDVMAHDMQRWALRGILDRTCIDPKLLDYVICGTVIQEVKTTNLAREASLGAGIPDKVPAYTCTIACISSNMATTNGCDLIRTGNADIVVAGGVELMSDVPIRFSRKVRQTLIQVPKVKNYQGYIKLASGLGLKDLTPETPAIAEFASGEVMGHSADRLAAMFGVSREDQDAFCFRSHMSAAKGYKEGFLQGDIVPVMLPPKFKPFTQDNGIKETPLEKLAKLKPAFIKPHGTITAASSSFLTDGASASLVMCNGMAKKLGYKPLSALRDYVWVAQDPKEQLLLGPAYATSKLFKKLGLTLKDIDVFEFHEAFAGQILANMAALNSDKFCQQYLGRSEKMGLIPMDKFNNYGGSLSLGHPFGATGTRLITTASRRLHKENGKLALVAACAAGGQGHAMIIERV